MADNIPPPIPYYTRRPSTEDAVHATLSQSDRVFLCGTYGSGKTELSRFIAGIYREEYHYNILWQLDGQTEYDIMYNLFKLKNKLMNVHQKPDSRFVCKVLAQESLKRAAICDIKRVCDLQKVLLIVDMLSPNMIETWFRIFDGINVNDNWKCICVLHQFVDSDKSVQIDCLGYDAAILFLENNIKVQHTRKDLDELIDCVTLLPLALDNACYSINKKHYSIQQYRQLHDECLNLSDIWVTEPSKKNVFATMFVFIDNLKHINFIVCFAFLCPSKPISERLIKALCAGTSVEKDAMLLSFKEDLQNCSLLNVQHLNGEVHFQLHDILSNSMRVYAKYNLTRLNESFNTESDVIAKILHELVWLYPHEAEVKQMYKLSETLTDHVRYVVSLAEAKTGLSKRSQFALLQLYAALAHVLKRHYKTDVALSYNRKAVKCLYSIIGLNEISHDAEVLSGISDHLFRNSGLLEELVSSTARQIQVKCQNLAFILTSTDDIIHFRRTFIKEAYKVVGEHNENNENEVPLKDKLEILIQKGVAKEISFTPDFFVMETFSAILFSNGKVDPSNESVPAIVRNKQLYDLYLSHNLCLMIEVMYQTKNNGWSVLHKMKTKRDGTFQHLMRNVPDRDLCCFQLKQVIKGCNGLRNDEIQYFYYGIDYKHGLRSKGGVPVFDRSLCHVMSLECINKLWKLKDSDIEMFIEEGDFHCEELLQNGELCEDNFMLKNRAYFAIAKFKSDVVEVSEATLTQALKLYHHLLQPEYNSSQTLAKQHTIPLKQRNCERDGRKETCLPDDTTGKPVDVDNSGAEFNDLSVSTPHDTSPNHCNKTSLNKDKASNCVRRKESSPGETTNGKPHDLESGKNSTKSPLFIKAALNFLRVERKLSSQFNCSANDTLARCLLGDLYTLKSELNEFQTAELQELIERFSPM